MDASGKTGMSLKESGKMKVFVSPPTWEGVFAQAQQEVLAAAPTPPGAAETTNAAPQLRALALGGPEVFAGLWHLRGLMVLVRRRIIISN